MPLRWYFLQHLQEMLAEFSHLRRYHCLAIRLIGVMGEVFLVIVLSLINLIQFSHFRHDGPVPDVLIV